MNKLKIALFTGGASPERPVSKLSSKSIYPNPNESGHEVMPVDPALDLKQHADVGDYLWRGQGGRNIPHKNYIAAMGLDVI
jgi:D-alanine-D-alanine ligase-like ATP-grasp enzyme